LLEESVINCQTDRTYEFFATPSRGQPLLIAEAGVGHFGKIERAFALIDLAKSAEFDVVKFQHYNPSELISKNHSPEWYERLGSRTLTDSEFKTVAEYAQDRGIALMCTAHEPVALKFLIENFELPALKIGSGEWRCRELTQICMDVDTPLVISTGMHSDNDVTDLEKFVATRRNSSPVFFLNCVSSYPTALNRINMKFLVDKINFGVNIWGHSDHCSSPIGCYVAISHGARIIERHVSLEADVPNAQDWKVSSMPSDALEFTRSCRAVYEMMRNDEKPIAEEIPSLSWAAKSPYLVRELGAEDITSIEDVKYLRPFYGLPPIDFENKLRINSIYPNSGSDIELKSLNSQPSKE
jgi:N,N'-diacetyllegionaminate synthase